MRFQLLEERFDDLLMTLSGLHQEPELHAFFVHGHTGRLE